MRVRIGYCTAENIAIIHECVVQDLKISISRRTHQLEILPTTPSQICCMVARKNEIEKNFSRKIIFSDEAHFHLSGYVKIQLIYLT